MSKETELIMKKYGKEWDKVRLSIRKSCGVGVKK